MNTQRPNAITVERKSGTATSLTGETTLTPVVVNTNIPARVQSKRLANMAPFEIGGITATQDAFVLVDGIPTSQFRGVFPGDQTVVNGITYTVAPNGLSAWPEIKTGYRVTDEYGTTYLVLAVSYFDVTHTLQALMASGRSW